MRDLRVTLVQCRLAWEAPEENRQQIGQLLAQHLSPTDLVVLPEMFTTGFSMNALANAEPPGGATERWMLDRAREYDCALAGSIAVSEKDRVYNRLLFATPDTVYHYDKRHLFRMAKEHERYAPGTVRRIVSWRGWRINLQVCYDLRFPVFSRNRGDYDLLLYVANWPAKRSGHWRTLLPARAIENQACVVGLNRVGSDANGIDYSGDSLIFAADGTLLVDMGDETAVSDPVVLEAGHLQRYREKFPCHLDADAFELL